jgi:hypothetical protein
MKGNVHQVTQGVHSAFKYLKNLNQDQSYLKVTIEKLRHVVD